PLGSTALAGMVDSIFHLRIQGGKRILSSRQRYGDDLEEIVLNLADGGDIVTLGSRKECEDQDARELILAALLDGRKTQEAIRQITNLRNDTLGRILRALVPQFITRSGTGSKGSPYFYSLAADAKIF